MVTYKGTDKDMKCYGGMQYAIGEKKTDDDAIRCGKKGFHSCEAPMDVLTYYPPDGNRFFECETSGKIDRAGAGDSKIASGEIELKAEIGLGGLVKAQIEYIKKSTVKQIAQGNQGHAAAQGDMGHAEVHGKDAIAASFGIKGAALGELGDWIVLSEWYLDKEDGWNIKEVRSAKIDGKNLKPNVWYKLVSGEFTEAELE